MATAVGYAHALEKLFRGKPVVTLADIQRALDVTSRTTVLKALRDADYVSSYSHAGRYYTLRRIPTFDARGLWFHGEIRFSTHGTLRATVVVLVSQAPAGHTHDELHIILGLRVHDTLRSLVEAGQIGRERVDAIYVYVDAESKQAEAQLERRRQASGAALAQTLASPPLDLARVVDVLLAVIHAPKDSPRKIAARLRASGLSLDEEQVEAVFRQYGLVKKTARSRSRASRR
jgi:hypothetical protein